MTEKLTKQFRHVRRHPYILVGGLLVLLVILCAIFAPLLTGHDPLEVKAKNRLLAPEGEHIMGTDEFGRDIFSRVLYGARVSLEIGITVVIATVAIGSVVGLIAGYFPKIDGYIMRVIDSFMAFPEIILAITLASIWGTGKLNIIFALSFAYFSRMARVVRGSALAIKELEFVEAGKAVGAKDLYLMSKYILPNCLSPIIVQATFTFATAILAESALSFLGVGIKAPEASWGGMVSQGRNYLAVAPWIVLYPGLAILVSVLGLNLLGDGLRDFLDPRLRS